MVEAINDPVDSVGGSSAPVAIAGAAVLIVAMVAVSTFDWMRLTWLFPAWGIALLCYAVLLAFVTWLGLGDSGFAIVMTAAVAYGFSYAYLISGFCPSRYPLDRQPRPVPPVTTGRSA